LAPKKFGAFEAAVRDSKSGMIGATCMELETLLERKREAILSAWRDLINNTYPPETSKFLGKQGDPFNNPLGHAISESVGQIYDEICSEMNEDRLLRALDGIIRIRSVQDFTVSETVSFIFGLKPLIQEVAETDLPEGGTRGELIDLDSRIDRVALLAFEKYMTCREKLHEIGINEIKNKVARLSQAAGADLLVSPDGKGPACTGADGCPVVGASKR
jgi:hypothetical protein